MRHQLERATHWVISGEALPNAPIASKRKRPSPRSRCTDVHRAWPIAAQADCTSGDSDGSRSDVEDASVSPSPVHAAVSVSESGQPSGSSCAE